MIYGDATLQFWEFFDCVLRDPGGKKNNQQLCFYFFSVLSQSCDCSYFSPPHTHAQTRGFMMFIFGWVYPLSVGFVRASGSCSRAVTVLWWMCRVSVSGEDSITAKRAGESVFSLGLYHTGQLETLQPASSGPGEHLPPASYGEIQPGLQCSAWPRKWAEFVFLS